MRGERCQLIGGTLLLWLGLFALAFANGALREVGIKSFVGEPTAHYLSATTAVLLFGAFVFRFWKRTRIANYRDAAVVGLVWLLLTVLTETFVLNRWLAGLTWEQILRSYDITRGQLWPLVLAWIGLLPMITRSIRGSAIL